MFLVGAGLLNTLIGLLAGERGFSSLEAGLIMSAYFLGYLMGIRFLPSLVGRVGHIRAFTCFAASISAIIILHGVFDSPLAWGLFRLLAGVCVVGFFLVMESWLNVVTTNRERGGVFSTYAMLNLMAIGVGQVLLMYARDAGPALFAWAAFFTVMAIIPVAVTYVEEPIRGDGSSAYGVASLWANVPLALAGILASGLTTGSFWGMAPFYLQRIGYDSGAVAFIMCATIFGASLLQWPIGRFSDRFDRRLFISGASVTAGALAIIVGLVGQTTNTYFLAVGFVYGGASFCLYGLCVAHANDYIAAEHRLSAARSLINMFAWGALGGPFFAGLSMTALGPAGLLWYFSLVFAMLAGYSIYRINIRLPAPEEEKSRFFPMVETSHAALELDPRLNEDSQQAVAVEPRVEDSPA